MGMAREECKRLMFQALLPCKSVAKDGTVSTDCKNSPEQNIANTSQLCLKLKRDPRALRLWS